MSGFKGTLSNEEACAAVYEALKEKGISANRLPVGDGGRGTLAAVHACLGGEVVTLEASGARGQEVEASVLCLPTAAAPEEIYIESADTCGAPRSGLSLPKDPLRASSYGLGELLAKAIRRWK